jgi:hypothetical protein
MPLCVFVPGVESFWCWGASGSVTMCLHVVVGVLFFRAGCLCPERESNLVDSASSHTLVSKIKPCMSKYKHLIL